MGKVIPKRRLRLLVAAVLVFLVLSPGRTQTRNLAPQPLGSLVDVGGYRVHVYRVGAGSPTVVITGAGYSFDWVSSNLRLQNSLACAPTITRELPGAILVRRIRAQ
jgi:hypothetical protein